MAQSNSNDEDVQVENPAALANMLHSLVEDLWVETDGAIDRQEYFDAVDEAFGIERDDK